MAKNDIVQLERQHGFVYDEISFVVNYKNYEIVMEKTELDHHAKNELLQLLMLKVLHDANLIKNSHNYGEDAFSIPKETIEFINKNEDLIIHKFNLDFSLDEMTKYALFFARFFGEQHKEPSSPLVKKLATTVFGKISTVLQKEKLEGMATVEQLQKIKCL